MTRTASKDRWRAFPAALALGTALTLLAGLPTSSTAAPPVRTLPEYRLKAALLYNIIKFVEWPDSAFPDPAAPIVVVVLGRNPFGDALDFLREKTVFGRPIAVRHAASVAEIPSCHVLYVSSSEREHAGRILARVRDAGVLTVSDIEGFAHRGGVVNFVRDGNRLAFEINAEAGRRERLKIDSKLLSLGQPVRPAPRD